MELLLIACLASIVLGIGAGAVQVIQDYRRGRQIRVGEERHQRLMQAYGRAADEARRSTPKRRSVFDHERLGLLGQRMGV